MKVEAQKEHEWLQQLVGEWSFQAEAEMGPDQPPVESAGSEAVRRFGDVWIVGEGEGEMPDDGDMGYSILTLGFDPGKQRFVGTWVGSMLSQMFVYEGTLDAAGKVLTLNTEGPEMTSDPSEATPGKTARYQDVIEIESPDRRTLTSRVLGEDGRWHEFMKVIYQRRA